MAPAITIEATIAFIIFRRLIYKLKSGEIIPAATKLFKILNRPKNITTRPAALKKVPDQFLFWMPSELKLKIASTGKVPIAKASIVSAPVQKLPVERA